MRVHIVIDNLLGDKDALITNQKRIRFNANFKVLPGAITFFLNPTAITAKITKTVNLNSDRSLGPSQGVP